MLFKVDESGERAIFAQTADSARVSAETVAAMVANAGPNDPPPVQDPVPIAPNKKSRAA